MVFCVLLLVGQTTRGRHMWTCPFHPPIQLYFIIRNTERALDFGISSIKIWNYNRSLTVRKHKYSSVPSEHRPGSQISCWTAGGRPGLAASRQFSPSSGWWSCQSVWMWGRVGLPQRISLAFGSAPQSPAVLRTVKITFMELLRCTQNHHVR